MLYPRHLSLHPAPGSLPAPCRPQFPALGFQGYTDMPSLPRFQARLSLHYCWQQLTVYLSLQHIPKTTLPSEDTYGKSALLHPIPLVSKGWCGGLPPFSARFMVLLFSSSGGGSGYSSISGMISVASFLKACHPWASTAQKAACTSRQTRHRARESCMVPARGGHLAFQ